MPTSAEIASPDPIVDMPRARARMQDADLEAVVAFSPAHVVMLGGYGTFLEAQLREWMVQPWGGAGYVAGFALLAQDGQRALAVTPLVEHEARRMAGPATVVCCPRGEPASALAEVLRQFGLDGGRVGIEVDGLPAGTRQAVAAAVPRASLVDASALLRLLRVTKSPEALRRLEAVAELTERALREAVAASRSPREMRSVYRQAIAREDAEFDHFAVGAGRGLAIERPPERGTGSCTYVDVGAARDRFFSDTGTTVAAHPGVKDRARHDRAHASVVAGAEALRVGARCSVVYEAMRAAAEAEPALKVQGHGLGLDIRELPILRPADGRRIRDGAMDADADLELEPGVVLNLEVSGFFEDGSSLQVEQSFVVEARGARPLTAQPRDIWRQE